MTTRIIVSWILIFILWLIILCGCTPYTYIFHEANKPGCDHDRTYRKPTYEDYIIEDVKKFCKASGDCKKGWLKELQRKSK